MSYNEEYKDHLFFIVSKPYPKNSWSVQVWQVLVADGILSRGPLNFSLSQLMKYLALQ